MTWKARMYGAFPEIERQWPTYKWVALTLTVRNCDLEDLPATLDTMGRGFQRLCRYKRFPGKGWVKALEVTHGKDGLCHPHLHVLLLVPSNYFTKGYVPQVEWAQLWKRAAQLDYEPVLHVQKVRGKRLAKDPRAAIRSAVAETVKYGVKPSDAEDTDWIFQLQDKVRGRRFVAAGGCLRPLLSPTAAADRLEQLEQDDHNPGGEVFDWRHDPDKPKYGRTQKPRRVVRFVRPDQDGGA